MEGPRTVRDCERELGGPPIWQRRRWVAVGTCDLYWECDETHPEEWHWERVRIRPGPQMGLVFEVQRQRPDGQPGEEWSPLPPAEVETIRARFLGERVQQLIAHPEVCDEEL